MLTKEKLLKFDLENELFNTQNIEQKYQLLDILYEIREIHNFLAELPSYPKMAGLIYSEEQIMAIGGTQSIEGITLTQEEIEEAFKKEERGLGLETAERTSVNLKRAYEKIIQYVSGNINNPIEERFVKQLHKEITCDLGDPSNTPGKYRNFPVEFGIPKRYSIIMTESEVIEAMKKFFKWLNIGLDEPFRRFPLIKANLAHFYFTEIHPFPEGNGRTARALEALILYKHGRFNNYCFWSLSNYYAINRNAYLDNLKAVSQIRDVVPFLNFASRGYLHELKRIKNRSLGKVKELMLMDYVHYLHRMKDTKTIKINQRIVSFMDYLCNIKKVQFNKFFENPVIKGIFSSVSKMTFRRDFQKMSSLKLIRITKDDMDIEYIEPNFKLLDELEY